MAKRAARVHNQQVNDPDVSDPNSVQPKSFLLSTALWEYLVDHGADADPVARELAERTRSLGSVAEMQVPFEEAAFLSLIVKISGATRAVEVGTFTGMSALAVARALPPEGSLTCFDRSSEWTDIGRPFWERAGVSHKIDLRIGDAAESLASMPRGELWDLAFVDADKEAYPLYWEELLARMPSGGVLMADNTLWSGQVCDPSASGTDLEAIRRFNDMVEADGRVDAMILPLADGVTLARIR